MKSRFRHSLAALAAHVASLRAGLTFRRAFVVLVVAALVITAALRRAHDGAPADEGGRVKSATSGVSATGSGAATDLAKVGDDEPAGSPLARLAEQSRAKSAAVAKARAFEDWLTAWRRAEPDDRPALAEAGLSLAAERRAQAPHPSRSAPRA